MKIFHKTLTWTTAGYAAALIVGAPAIADDTELLLLSPNAAQNPKPNVLFVLDTSGSMDDPQTTTEPYDHNVTYTGSCQTGAMYWTDVDLLPSCDPANLQWINKAAFQCEFAKLQVEGIGAFTNTMVQFRDSLAGDDNDTSNDRWDYLEPGNHDAPVECLSDSGVHGDGTPSKVYASSTTGEDWTNDEDEEVAWGSAPRNLSYTLYDGNYLNWKANPVSVDMRRTDIMKAVTKTVLSSVNNMNVGIMRFNDLQGGSIVTGVTDLATNRTAILDTITNLPADGWTPLSEVLYESARYWKGESMDFGDAAITDTGSLAVTTPGGEIYDQPTLGACAKNYNVLISDGLPTEDDDGPTKAPTLPEWSTVLGGRTGCNGTVEQGYCLDDVAEYLRHGAGVRRQVLPRRQHRRADGGPAADRWRDQRPRAVLLGACGVGEYVQPDPQPEQRLSDDVRCPQQGALARQPEEIRNRWQQDCRRRRTGRRRSEHGLLLRHGAQHLDGWRRRRQGRRTRRRGSRAAAASISKAVHEQRR